MSLATIITKIEEEASVQSQEILEQANIEAQQILTQARVKAEEEAEQILQQTQTELEGFKKKQMATTLLQVRKEKLHNRQQILRNVFDEVLRRISSFEDTQQQNIIKTILLSVPEERDATLLFSQADKSLGSREFIEAINVELAARHRKLHFTASTDTANIERGVIVDFKDFEINYSVENILASVWEKMKGEVSTQLFANDVEKEG